MSSVRFPVKFATCEAYRRFCMTMFAGSSEVTAFSRDSKCFHLFKGLRGSGKVSFMGLSCYLRVKVIIGVAVAIFLIICGALGRAMLYHLYNYIY